MSIYPQIKYNQWTDRSVFIFHSASLAFSSELVIISPHYLLSFSNKDHRHLWLHGLLDPMVLNSLLDGLQTTELHVRKKWVQSLRTCYMLIVSYGDVG